MFLVGIHLYLAVTLTVVSMSWSQIIGIGPCPTPKVQKNFDIKRFSGKWYQIERYQGDYTSMRTIRCNIVTYTIVDNDTVAINNTYISTALVGTKSVQGTYNAIWQGKVVDPNEPSRMVVQTQIGPDDSYYGDGSNLLMHYRVLDTDYANNALVWTCTSNGKLFMEYAEILHRTDNLSQTDLDAIHRGLSPYYLYPQFVRSVRHNQTVDCDY